MGNRLMAARVVTQPNFYLDDLHPLPQLDLRNFSEPIFDLTRDGQRFVVLTADHARLPGHAAHKLAGGVEKWAS
jgi:hypothetical protein